MMETGYRYDLFAMGNFEAHQIVKPNRITGEGRMKARRHCDKAPDLKKKQHRKMAKKSKRLNRR